MFAFDLPDPRAWSARPATSAAYELHALAAAALEQEAPEHLFVQRGQRAIERVTNEEIGALIGEIRGAEVRGEQRRPQPRDHPHERLARRQRRPAALPAPRVLEATARRP